MELETLAQRITRLRIEKGLSKADLAAKVGLTMTAISKWESGQTQNLKRHSLLRLAAVFGLSSDEILTGKKTGRTRHAQQTGSVSLNAWKAYCEAPPETQAAIDLLLLPTAERERIDKSVLLSIAVLEERAMTLLKEKKKVA